MRRFIMLAAVLSVSTPVFAAEPVATAFVTISDLNLASSNGQRVLTRRIASAVEQVCGSYANAREQYEQMQLDAQVRHGRGNPNADVASNMANASTAASSGIDNVRMGGEVG